MDPVLGGLLACVTSCAVGTVTACWLVGTYWAPHPEEEVEECTSCQMHLPVREKKTHALVQHPCGQVSIACQLL